MKKQEMRKLVKKILGNIEEEDVGINLMTTYYQVEEELNFFSEPDRQRIAQVFQRLTDDSRQHKALLLELILHLENKVNE